MSRYIWATLSPAPPRMTSRSGRGDQPAEDRPFAARRSQPAAQGWAPAATLPATRSRSAAECSRPGRVGSTGLGVGEGVADGEGEAEWEGEEEGDGDGEAEGEAEGDAEGERDGDADGEALGLPKAADHAGLSAPARVPVPSGRAAQADQAMKGTAAAAPARIARRVTLLGEESGPRAWLARGPGVSC